MLVKSTPHKMARDVVGKPRVPFQKSQASRSTRENEELTEKNVTPLARGDRVGEPRPRFVA